MPKFLIFKNIFFQSMPITVSICGYALAAAIIFTYVGQSGEYAVAGYGVGTRIEQVVLLPILGIIIQWAGMIRSRGSPFSHILYTMIIFSLMVGHYFLHTIVDSYL